MTSQTKKIVRLISLTFCIFTSSLCFADINQNIQNIIDRDRETYQIPAVQVSVFLPNETSARDFASGTTTRRGNIPVTPDHLFQIGSETKTFIATIILLLEADGLLSIENPIGKWLPTIPNEWKNIPIRQLLNHTSGIFNYTDSGEFWNKQHSTNWKLNWSNQQLIDFVVKHKPSLGKGYSYSNTNYILAGMIIETVTGQSIEYVLQSRLFNPLHLNNTYYDLFPEKLFKQMAHGYSKYGAFPNQTQGLSYWKDITAGNITWGRSAGAIISTSHDVAVFFNALMHGKILPAKQQEEMMSLVSDEKGLPVTTKDRVDADGLGIGYGYIYNQDVWAFAGGTIGYRSQMFWLSQDDITVAVTISNAGHNDTDKTKLIDDLANYLIALKK